MPGRLSRLARMDRAELSWRAAAAARIAAGRLHVRVVAPAWDRGTLLSVLTASTELSAVRDALAAARWQDAQRALAVHFTSAPQRFLISAAAKRDVAARIRGDFPQSAAQATARADRILNGEYDLLGYHGLRFAAAGGLNRHQHWVALGRAYWLTDDPKYRNRCLAELRSWLDTNPPLMGINWTSMLELAFRSLSWLWAINFFAAPAADDAPWLVDLLVAIDRQLAHVERNLSYYFSPNTHLLGEALALYVTGTALPELAASGRRAALGRKILLDEIPRQIAADGGHCERSTHYHRYTLDFYLLALIVARIGGDDDAVSRFGEVVGRLATAARMLSDDRGRMPH
ncbi:MAG: hypothetical protein JF601_10675, partial [Acidobacteria bacterium]|nr:hypothetical protein [Acidobacteriota bacterium]